MNTTDQYKGMRLLIIKMPDGSKWGVNVNEIALNRAQNYADEFDNSVERSLKEDTLALFKECPEEISDWAANNMNWDEFKNHYLIEGPPEVDFQEGWMSGEKEVMEY